MNPITITAIPIDGVIDVFLGSKFNGYVGLVDITLPRIETSTNIVSVSCDQVDSTCFNRKRLLRVFYNRNLKEYTSHEFTQILYNKIDSSDYKLTIRLFDDEGPLTFTHLKTVVITLNLQPDQPKKWMNV